IACCISFCQSSCHPPSSTLFPYTTLFRSVFNVHQECRAGLPHGRDRQLHVLVDVALQKAGAVLHAVTFFSHEIDRLGCDLKRFRSEEHTSELQSRGHLVCRLLLEKKTTKL